VSGSPRHLLVIGAQRCGTTYLHDLLADHPQVTMARPARPEPKVFLSDEVLERGVGWYDATWFGHATAATRVLGEKSTSYLERPDAIARAASVLDDPLVLVQLRDPVERAISNWAFSTAGGLEDRPLDEALTAELDGEVRAWDPERTSVSPYRYLARGRYADELAPWREATGERLHVTFLEEVGDDPGVLGEVYRFLGVDPDHEPAGRGTPVNSARGGAPVPDLPAGLRQRLRGYFADSDRALASLLGRTPPWATTTERSRTP
jgi:Sulfotransferase domain